MEKGISPFLAAVLLIALVMAIGIFIGPTILQFARETAEVTTETSQAEVACRARSGLLIRKVIYNESLECLRVKADNTGLLNLQDFKVEVVFENQTSAIYSLNGSATLPGGEVTWYRNESIGSFNFSELRLLSETCPNTASDSITLPSPNVAKGSC